MPASPALRAFRVAAACAPALLCLLAPRLGSALGPALAITVAGMLVTFPPARPSPGWLGAVFAAAAAAPLLALLPVPESAMPAWRVALKEDLGLDLGPLVTPQPFALLGALPSYWSGLGYLWWICGQQWDALESRVLARGILAGIAVIATAVLWSKISAYTGLPGVLSGGNPALSTRNQLATILAIGTAVGATFACARTGAVATIFGAGAAMLCVFALALLGSRGGWIVAGIGTAAALLTLATLHRSAFPVLITAVLLVAGAGSIAILPGETGARLRTSLSLGLAGEYRPVVQRDALDLIADHPWTGHGLGSFDGVFSFHRERSRGAFRAEHPESDLLWFAGEAGLLAVALALAGIVGMTRGGWQAARVAPERTGPAAAALGTMIIVLAHGLLDVPAHSPLAWFLAVGIVGAAFGESGCTTRSRLSATVIAIGLVGAAAATLLSLPRERPRPFAHDTSIDEVPPATVIDAWLAAYPLDWRTVELRAHRSLADGDEDAASRQFELAERLTPFDTAVTERALHAWRRANNPRRFARALARLLRRASGDPANHLPSISHSTRWPAAALELAALDPPLAWELDALDIPPSLRIETLARLAAAGAEHGDVPLACRIVVFQIGPIVGERFPSHALPPPFTAEGRSGPKAPHRPESWYDIAVAQMQSGNSEHAWRILHVYLCVKISEHP